MMIPTSAFHQHDAIIGPTPTLWCGVDVPDGDAFDFATAGVGSVYYYIDTTNDVSRQYTKIKNDGADNDWATNGVGVVRQTVAYSDFTDGGAAVGTLALDVQIPVMATVLSSSVTNVTGFTGDTSCTLTIGDGSDADRYNTGTPSIFTTANAIVMGVCSGDLQHNAAATVTLTATSNNDWGAVTAGAMTVSVYYLL
jgi:hypothetical protein